MKPLVEYTLDHCFGEGLSSVSGVKRSRKDYRRYRFVTSRCFVDLGNLPISLLNLLGHLLPEYRIAHSLQLFFKKSRSGFLRRKP